MIKFKLQALFNPEYFSHILIESKYKKFYLNAYEIKNGYTVQLYVFNTLEEAQEALHELWSSMKKDEE